jgi:hypothetical protein
MKERKRNLAKTNLIAEFHVVTVAFYIQQKTEER